MMEKYKGSCACGAISFEVKAPLPSPNACHCSICRKHHGHFEVGTDVTRKDVAINGEEKLTWYSSSKKARRGFCSVCGSSLFFDPIDKIKNDWIGISMGAFDTPTNTKIKQHIFVAHKGDYYDIKDGLPQNSQ